MHIGTAAIFQNTNKHATDREVYRRDVRLAELAEPLGFESVWTVEHHFTPYTMVNSPTQFLSYFAGATRRISMGTMIVVLPWHDPIKVAEGYIALDHMLNGRGLKVGFGRGLGLREYDGMRVPMDESRERFKESLAPRMAGRITAAFQAGEPAPTAAQLANEIGVAPRSALDVLDALIAHGLLARTYGDEDDGFVPGRDPDGITVFDLRPLRTLAHQGRITDLSDSWHDLIFQSDFALVVGGGRTGSYDTAYGTEG